MNMSALAASLILDLVLLCICTAQQPSLESDETVRFVVVGDTQGGEFGGRFLDELVRDIQSHEPDYVLIPGDLVADSGLKGWNAWSERTAEFGERRLMTPGNHDVGPGSTFEAWQSTFDWLPDSKEMNGRKGIDQVDYFVDYKGVRFVSISTDRPGKRFAGGEPEALDWLNEVFKDIEQRNRDRDSQNDIRHVFTFSHRPITTQMESGTGGTSGKWWKTMTGQIDDHSVVTCAFLPGHWHMYQPSRPDPGVPTMEIIIGTGGGGLEGATHRNRHGFLVVDVVGNHVSARFLGDKDNSQNGWSFVDELDEFNVAGVQAGELAFYDFSGTGRRPLEDKSTSTVSRGHVLNLHGDANIILDQERSHTLSLPDGRSYADATAIGDNNLAVLGNLSLELDFRLDEERQGGTLICFGGAHEALNKSLARQESANCAYQIDINSKGRVQVSWQHGDSVWERVESTAGIDTLSDWHELRVVRNHKEKKVNIFLDGKRLGDPLNFSQSPSGGGSGSLYIGSSVGGESAIQGEIDNIRISGF